MRTRSWWWTKANALAPAVARASISKLALLLAVATHETGCGDYWPGENNWGATTRGALSADEAAQLEAANVRPTLAPQYARERTEKAATAILGPRPDRAIHVDSRPVREGPRAFCMHHAAADHHAALMAALPDAYAQVIYFTWFAAFPTAAEGAAYFAGFFKTKTELAALNSANPEALARAMFAARYYTGTSPIAEEDIATYTRAIAPLYAEAMAMLVGWKLGAEAAVEPAQGWTWQQVQAALNAAGASPELKVDGIVGPKTRGALRAFQQRLGLPGTALADEATVQALRGEANA